jgi:hypothetical protein
MANDVAPPAPVISGNICRFDWQSSMTGRLNTFQKSMLQWNDLHAYNAVHVVRIPGESGLGTLPSSIHATLEKRGLTYLTLDRATHHYHYEASPDGCDVQAFDPAENPLGLLVAEIGRQLNLPFPCHQRFCPFRFLIVPAGDSVFLGLVYFHPIADAESVVFLLKDIVNHHRQLDAPGFSGPLNLYPDARAHLLSRHLGVVVRRVLGLPAQIRRLRRSHRVTNRDANDLTNGFTFFSVKAGDLDSLVATARGWSVTVNDLFLAILMKSLASCAEERLQSRKRDQISVGCIVNTRRQIGIDGRQTFGLFLGSFIVTHGVRDPLALRELAGQVSEQTTLIKRNRLYLGTAMELSFASFLLRFFSPRQQRTFYSKNWPLLGGVTNMNLNALWEPSESDARVPMDYFRGVSTGPITPLVLSVTTTGDHANIGLSYRRSVFSADDVEKLKCRFLEQLNETGRGG